MTSSKFRKPGSKRRTGQSFKSKPVSRTPSTTKRARRSKVKAGRATNRRTR